MKTRNGMIALAMIAALPAAAAEPQNYWCLKGDFSAADAFVLDDGTYTGWNDGNVLCLVGSNDYLPENLRDCERKVDGILSYNGTVPLKMHGLCVRTGWRFIGGTGSLELGAGGYKQHPGCWDGYYICATGGLRLTASQTWNLRNGIAFSDYNASQYSVNTASVCPVTADEGVVLTIVPTNNAAWTKYTGVKFYGPDNDFSKADIVVNSEWLQLGDAEAKINARSITLDGTANASRTRIYAETNRPPVIDSDFTDHFVLKGGVELKLYSGVWRLRAESPDLIYDDIIYDVAKITVASGTSRFGDGYTYSVKDGGVQAIEVLEGAVADFVTLPKSGRVKVSGAGEVRVPGGLGDVDYAEDFTGSVVVTDYRKAMASLSGLAGFTVVLDGASTVAWPAMSDWPEGLDVVVRGDSRLYLPEGSAVDEGRVSVVGNGACFATARGLTEVTDETVTVGAGETLTIVGSGFTEGTSIVLAGGRLVFPLSCTVASPVSVTADSGITAFLGETAIFTGDITVNALIDSSNGVSQVASTDATLYPCGRTVFTGDGMVTAGGVCNSGGALEFRGCEWNFSKETLFRIRTHGILTELTSGAEVTLADGDNSDEGRRGLYIGNGNGYPGTLLVRDGSEITFGTYRRIQMGEESWKAYAAIVVDNAMMRVLGEGEFNIGGNDRSKIKMESSDRCPMVRMTVRNGGVIETDRVFGNTVASHVQDSGGWLGTNYVEGPTLELDGGTYRLGPLFGSREEDGTLKAYQRQHPNQLFSSVTIRNVDMTVGMTNTAEIVVEIGAGGGTFDLSGTSPYNSSFTNTVSDVFIPFTDAQKEMDVFAGMDHMPCLGPRWVIGGPLRVKGNGAQELVLNGIDPSDLSSVSADGAVLKIVDTNGVESVALDSVTLGAAGSGLTVESEEGSKVDVSVSGLAVAAGGVYDAGAFDPGHVSIGDVVFGDGSVLAARGVVDGVPLRLPISGTVTLASEMGYFVPRGLRSEGILLDPVGGLIYGNGAGVTWSRAEGSARKIMDTSGDIVRYRAYGTKITVK
ncbi:MAG: hypothetical protein IKJ37_01525 [Kiritimatiellae bacterium]|nr:hypothetical protein [Kiritimatiellia bacterium]